MTPTRVAVGALVWAVVAAIVSLGALPPVSGDGFWFVAVCSVVFPAAAGGAAVAARRGRGRLAGVLLIISAATPTYFAWVLNVPALVVGAVLVCTKQLDRAERRRIHAA